jgi:hypothetical protein
VQLKQTVKYKPLFVEAYKKDPPVRECLLSSPIRESILSSHSLKKGGGGTGEKQHSLKTAFSHRNLSSHYLIAFSASENAFSFKRGECT